MADIVLRQNLSRKLTAAEGDANIANLNTELVAASAAIAALQTAVASRATVAALNAGLASKADTGHTHSMLSITGLSTALASKLDMAALGAANGVAALGPDGKLQESQLPAISLTDYLGEVANESAMLALTGQLGDWCIRLDTGTTWLVRAQPTSVIGSWRELSYPSAPVTSVAGRTGSITLTRADVGLTLVDNTPDTAKPISTATQLALNGKAATGHSHTTADIAGLSTALAGKSDTGHVHAIANVTGLQEALDAKAQAAHSHAIGNIAGLQAALNAKQDVIAFQNATVDVGGPVTTINFVGFSVTRSGSTLTVAPASNGVLTRLAERLTTRSGNAITRR